VTLAVLQTKVTLSTEELASELNFALIFNTHGISSRGKEYRVADIGFIGSRVMISISDPWDFASENNQPIPGTIREFSIEPRPVFLVHLGQPVRQGNISLRDILAIVRHKGVDPSALTGGQEIPCSCSGVPDGYRLSQYTIHGDPTGPLNFLGGMKLISQ
jgi:hypothetical protein